MATERQIGLSKRCAVAVLVLLLFPVPGTGQSAPGVLPWAAPKAQTSDSKKGAKEKKDAKSKNRKGPRQKPGQPAIHRVAGGVLQTLSGMASFGFESAGSEQGGGRARTNVNLLALDLETRGFLFDPRLWTHNLSLRLDRSGFGSPLQTSTVNGLGVYFGGTLFGGRSFPLRVSFARRAANTNLSGPADTGTRFSNLGLNWSLNQPRLANITVSALFGRTSTDADSVFLSFRERQRSFAVGVSRSFLGWFVSGSADYNQIRNSLNGYGFILRGKEVRVQRSVREGGDLTISLNRLDRSDSDRQRPPRHYALTSLLGLLTYRHTEKLHGTYSVTFLSNIREAVVSTALQAATGFGKSGPAVDLGPALNQLLLPGGETRTLTSQAGWTFALSPRLSLTANVSHSGLGTPESLSPDPGALLSSYTTVGGGVNYRQSFGPWDTNWRAGLLRVWNRPRRGDTFADKSGSFGVGVRRRLGRWEWASDLSYSQYISGSTADTLFRQQRWTNLFETRLTGRLRVSIGAELLHFNSRFASLRELNGNRENSLLLHGTLTDRAWSVTVGQGLRNINSAALALDLANPLNTALLSEVSPLVTSFSNAGRYLYVNGTYRPFRDLILQGVYRRDRFQLPQGDFSRYHDTDFSISYRLRRLVVTAGYRQLHQEVPRGQSSRDTFYMRFGRPFRIF